MDRNEEILNRLKSELAESGLISVKILNDYDGDILIMGTHTETAKYKIFLIDHTFKKDLTVDEVVSGFKIIWNNAATPEGIKKRIGNKDKFIN